MTTGAAQATSWPAQRALWAEQAEALRQQYPDQFVAIVDGVVVAYADEIPELLEALQRLQLAPEAVTAYLLADPPLPLIL